MLSPSSKWFSWVDLSLDKLIDVHVVLARDLVSHHKLAAAFKNEVISCGRNEQSRLEKPVSHSPYCCTTKCKLSLYLKKHSTKCQVMMLFPHFAARNQKCWNITKMFSYEGQSGTVSSRNLKKQSPVMKLLYSVVLAIILISPLQI